MFSQKHYFPDNDPDRSNTHILNALISNTLYTYKYSYRYALKRQIIPNKSDFRQYTRSLFVNFF